MKLGTVKGHLLAGCVVACIAGAMLSGCSTPYVGLAEPGQVVRLETVAIRPPPGKDWDYFKEKDDDWNFVWFLRRGETPSHHFVADLAEIEKPAGMDDYEEIRTKILRPAIERFIGTRKREVTRRDVEDDSRFSDREQRFLIEAKDFEAPGRGDAEYLNVRLWGYAFIHPQHPDVVVIVAMLERGHADELDEASKAMAEEFFSGLELLGK